MDTSQFDFQVNKDYFTDHKKGNVERGNRTVSIGVCGSIANIVQMEKARKKKDRKYVSPYKGFLGGKWWLPHFIRDENEDSWLNDNVMAQLAALSTSHTSPSFTIVPPPGTTCY